MERYQTAQHVINEICNDSGKEKFYSELRQTLQQMRKMKALTLMIWEVSKCLQKFNCSMLFY